MGRYLVIIGTVMLAALALAALGVATSDSSAVGYTQWLIDPEDDVLDLESSQYVAHDAVDIHELKTELSYDTVVVTMWLAGAHDTCATYSVNLLIDGMDYMVLQWDETNGFTGELDSAGDLNVTGLINDPSHWVIWRIPVGELGVTQSFRLLEGAVNLYEDWTVRYSDEIRYEYPPFPTGAQFMEFHFEFESVTSIKRSVYVHYEGAWADHFRASVDVDGDGYISGPDLDQFWQGQGESGGLWAPTSMHLNDEAGSLRLSDNYTHVQFEPVVSGQSFYLMFTHTIEFPEPEGKCFEYWWYDDLNNIELFPCMRATPDSEFMITVPPDDDDHTYRFSLDDVEEPLIGFYKANNTKFIMTGTDLSQHWDVNMRMSYGFTITAEDKEKTTDDNGCDVGKMIVMVPVAFMTLTWRRRRHGCE